MAVEGTAAAPSPTDVARRRLFRVAGIAGLAAVVLIFVAVLVGTRQEPTFNAAATEVLSYYQSPNTPGADFRSFVLTVGLITFVWFVVALTTLLRRAEGEPPWRSTIAMVSGVLLVAPVLSGSEVAAAFRADDLDPQIARYAFDEAQAAFANARVALGSFAVCCGWVIVSTRFLPRWLGWLAIASGVGLVLSRISWTSYIFLLPYGLFWLWVLVVAVLLIRRGTTGGPQRRTG
jgi:magnesium-transporting ATPase (P-type)